MNASALALVGVLAAALAMPAAQSRKAFPLDAADCADVNMQFGDDVTARAVQFATVPVTVGVLDVYPDANGGVVIERGAGASYSITACIGAGGSNVTEAQQGADAVRIAVEGGRVRVRNEGRARNWSVHLIVAAPERARIQVETSNGPIGIRGVSGQITARSSNGPIGLHDVAGSITARAQNGPISVSGRGGDVDIQTDNGPIHVALTGTRWEGRLDARANNGPLRVELPSGYQSGVEVMSSDRSPWNCGIAACQRGNRDWDDRSRSLRVGPEPIVVRIATSNGPVSVQQR
jgi:hypothetical protein